MKKLSVVILFAFLLCACFAGVCSAAEECVLPTPGVIVQPGDSIQFNERTLNGSLTALWFTPTPTATPVPAKPGVSSAHPAIPNTGDNTHPGSWIALLGVCTAAAAAAAIRRRKYQN